ncbi:unnamed protein product [Linum tenue]|uniref:Uncharacterized protein n=1 Tax=Linum tenue TaxID=586396 RepID=A0AAV0ICB7_9ROSI|nr:unnamed protein product [Linum tenue]
MATASSSVSAETKLNLVKEIRTHEVAVAELGHLPASRNYLIRPKLSWGSSTRLDFVIILFFESQTWLAVRNSVYRSLLAAWLFDGNDWKEEFCGCRQTPTR